MTSEKLSKSFISGSFWTPSLDQTRDKRSSFVGLGGPKVAKRFVSAGFASGAVFGPPYLVAKQWPSKVCEEVSREKNGAIFFSSHVSDRFWRTVFRGGFSCRAERVFLFGR